MAFVRLKKRREKSLLNRHPWVFSGAVDSVTGSPEPGDIVNVFDADDSWLACGYYNGNSNIRVRVLEWEEGKTIDESWWRDRIAAAVDRRSLLMAGADTSAYRLVFSEADGLPGLIVDRYGDHVAVQLLTAGVERQRVLITGILEDVLKPAAIFDRSDDETRRKEKLKPSTGAISGTPPDGPIEILENGHAFYVDFFSAQKTGFYLDQRDNRRLVAAHAGGLDVLDAFSYTGAFSVYAGRAGAKSLTLVESSKTAIDIAGRNVQRNAVHAPCEYIQGDVFDVLRSQLEAGRRYGLVILDPPRFARTPTQADQALRGYKDINMLAMKLLAPDGVLATFSCSGGVDVAQFTRAVAWAALDAGRQVQVTRRLGHPQDHPVLLSVPESEYLKGLICRVL
jgi:23S rRNA (cytosine1962-C5)-methyltransferase